MGRYATFNTGFDYKFVFGVQPSNDIEFFGGIIEDTTEDDNRYTYESKITWSIDDQARCLSVIRTIESECELPVFNFTNYQNSIEGTYVLYTDAYNIQFDDEKYDIKIYHKYILGLLIYQQLNYCCPLKASYEIY